MTLGAAEFARRFTSCSTLATLEFMERPHCVPGALSVSKYALWQVNLAQGVFHKEPARNKVIP